MDYGMVAAGPDRDPKTGQITHLFNLRSLFAALKVTQASFPIVSNFITFLNTDSSVTRPIGNIYLGAHAAGDGTVTIQMIPKQPKEHGKYFADYEILERAADSGVLLINNATIGPDPKQHFFHFKGCNIGRAPVFLEKWQAVMGGQIQITAPRFNHGAFNDGRGVWEFMLYEFVVTSPTPLEDRDALIQEFQKKKFSYVETEAGGSLQPGPPVPDDVWDGWLPNTIKTLIDAQTGNKFIKRKEYPQHRSFSVQALALPFATMDVNEQFQAQARKFSKKIPGLNPMPTSQADRMAALQTFFLTDAENFPHVSRYDAAKKHPFPMYQRFGYNTFADFIAGFTWKFSTKSGSSDLYVTGTREEYTLFIALTDPNPGVPTTANQLLTNFHPTAPGFLPGEQLPVTDPSSPWWKSAGNDGLNI